MSTMDTVWTEFSVVREEAEEKIEMQPENTKLHNNEINTWIILKKTKNTQKKGGGIARD